jgi:hypothetical protein
METIILYKLFKSYGIQDILPKVQEYVDQYNYRFTKKGAMDELYKIKQDIDKINKVKHELSNRREIYKSYINVLTTKVNKQNEHYNDEDREEFKKWLNSKKQDMIKWYDESQVPKIIFEFREPCSRFTLTP